MGAHNCGQKIFEQLKRQFFWPNMRAHCEKWAQECPICAFCREPRKNLPPLSPIEVHEPWEMLCLDILDLGISSTGNKYVLSMVDHFTKYLVAVPLPNKTADGVARALVERVILVFGTPKSRARMLVSGGGQRK